MSKQYIRLIAELKQSIIQSRYVAARLANILCAIGFCGNLSNCAKPLISGLRPTNLWFVPEQLLLYFKTGKMLSEKIAAERWGVKVLVQIAEDLQKQLPKYESFVITMANTQFRSQ